MRSPGAGHAIEAAANRADRREPEASVRINAEFALLRLCEASHNRNNWLFAGSLRAGKRAAAVMSLVHSARLNGHDPYAYLKDILERLPTQPASRVEDLLPYRWQPEPATT